MKKNSKSLSVILPNYNHGNLVGESLDAILDQSYQPLEIIVTDDGSTDDSVEVIEKYAKKYPNLIKFIKNEINLGGIKSGNKMISLARGDYICTPSSDDRCLPGYFQKLMELFELYPQAGLCCGDSILVNTITGTLKEYRRNLTDHPAYLSPDDFISLIKNKYIYITGASTIIKRSALIEAGSCIKELEWHSDWFAMLIIILRYGMCYIPQTVTSLLMSPNTYSARGSNSLANNKAIYMIMKLLKSPQYNDVLEKVKQGNVLSWNFRLPLIRIILKNRSFWDFLSFTMIKRILWNECFILVIKLLPLWLKKAHQQYKEKQQLKYSPQLREIIRNTNLRKHLAERTK